MDTRPELTRADFAKKAAYAYENWWLTGEESFVHVSSVMNVEAWNIYGHPGNTQLTEPQRVLMMWSDLVGQTSNGGFVQFVDNYSDSLALAYQLISQLGWPDLFERFDRAFREQVGDPADPKPRQDSWSEADDAAVAANRELMISELARANSRWKPWARQRERAMLAAVSETILQGWYEDAVERGEIKPRDESQPTYGTFGGFAYRINDSSDDRVTEAADAFDTWFYLDETKAASRLHIGDYIVRHRDQLCRLID